MAFSADEIEDGSGKPGAIVYSSTGDPVAEAELILARLGKTVFTALTGSIGTVPKKEVHLVLGTRYVEYLAQGRAQGRPSVEGQGLLQPRRGQYVDGYQVLWEQVPGRWIRACAIAAELSAAGKLLHAVVETERNVKREVIGPIETEYTEAGKQEAERYAEVLAELEPLLELAGTLERG